MDVDDLNDKSLSEGKRKALELAEDSREKDWEHPSFVAELFRGKVRWDLVSPYPNQTPEDKAIGDAFLKKLEKVLIENIDPDEVDRTGEVPQKAIKALAEIKCFALKIPKEYGGLELSQVNYNRAMHLISSYCSSTTVYLSAHQSIGVPQPLKLFGTPEQKKKYLPRFAEGAISAFALTEPEVGSDPAKMTTTATLTEDGKHYLINGLKLWCTNGPVADILIVMAQTPPKVVNGRERKQITAFIVEKAFGGIEVVHRCEFMGLKGIQNGLLKFNNVKVPKENIVLGEGKGLKIALTTLNTGRLTMPAGATGGSKWCLKVAREWANERVQWGNAIGKHEAVAHKISTMAATIFAMDAVTYIASKMADDENYDIRLEAAMAKLCCTEASWRIIDGTIQIRGGRGYETGPSLRARGEKGHAVERMLRDARINTIIEGTSQIMRLFIAREAMDTHVRHIMPLMAKKSSPKEKLSHLVKAIKFYSLWYPKQFLPGSQLPSDTDIPVELKSHMKFIGRQSKKLARNLFHAMGLYQQKLETKQHLMARLVNVGTDLFAMSATCSKAISMLKANPNDRGPAKLADLFCVQSRGRINKQFKHLFLNRDKDSYDLAQEILDDKYAWLENDIIGPLG
jgi:alkylation response protein AidB-like acyl-CoA dehydrogenase